MGITKRDRVLWYGLLATYFLIILFITLLIRDVGLSRVVNLVPFSSYKKAVNGNTPMLRQVLLNIGLFVPYGWLICGVTCRQKRRSVVITQCVVIATSLLIETLQFITYRGQFDIDDLINNAAGGIIGIGLFYFLTLIGNGRLKILQTTISVVLIAVGLGGCIYTVKTKVNQDYTQYFDFRIDSAVFDGETVEIKGRCYMYNRDTPKYSLALIAEDQIGSRCEADVEREDQSFTACARVSADNKYEILIRFAGHSETSTGVWLKVGESIAVEYVPGDVQIPIGVPKEAILKAYSEEYDTYVFEINRNILWLIGWRDLDSNTEIIYQMRTDEVERLPEGRKQYKSDNRGYIAEKSEKHEFEIDGIDYYRVFEKEIPIDYHITQVIIGFNTNGTVVWWSGFRVDSE